MTYNARITSVALSRTLHNKSRSLHEVKEIDIPVPWGKVAGKLWGSQDKQPILAMHGWQDNAASFDNLAPFLLKNTPILAIDLPGHGLSSWLPPGFMYNEIVYFLLIKRIKKHFGWKKMKLLTHSLSSMTTYWYAATFPMDLQYLEESNGVQPNYTYDELLKKGLANMVSDMDEATYKILMNRGSTKREDGKYIINRDPRLRIIPIHTLVAQEHQEQYAKLITCPYLIIKGSKLHEEKKENFYRPIEIMKSVNNNVHFKTLSRISKTTHHFHLTNAEETAAIINPFLEQYN
ncbi:hypothetical protein HN011_002114 [Eciton burchellii]|nr:hypothetical protein HN011_002114 [Eciton burchellii]